MVPWICEWIQSAGFSAAEWLNSASEKEISDILYQYGDERASRKIAKAIVELQHQRNHCKQQLN